MSKHDEDLLEGRLRRSFERNRQLVRALKDVCAIVEAVGLYSMPALNIAYALIGKEEARGNP